MSTSLPPNLLAAIRRDFPGDFLSTDSEDLLEFGKDWTKVYAPAAAAIAFPRTTDEVSRLLALCNQYKHPIVPSGGRTGLAGGAVARDGELVLSLSRMRQLNPVDVLGATVRVQAGAVTQAVHEHCAEQGLTWPIDFASKGSSQVGGNISTNAGGVRVIRYGHTRHWVLGLQVVLANGEVLELNGALEKNNTGLDLRQLFIGSEGTLGVITEATLKLTRLPRRVHVFLFALPDLASVIRLYRESKMGPFTIMAFEFFTDRCLNRVLRHRKLRDPFDAPSSCYALLEVEHPGVDTSDRGDLGPLEGWISELFERELVSDGVLAQHAQQAAELWSLREGISESLSATGLPHKNDVALPVAALEAFCADLEALFEQRYKGWEVCLFGHIGDGNIHVNVMKPDDLSSDEFFAKTKAADHDTFALVQKHQGSISAEHGIGLLKKDFLHYSRSPAELQLLKSVKQTFDPNNILNPGKIFD